MANPKIRAVILDYGGVLSYLPRPEQVGRIAYFLNVEVDLLRKLYQIDRLAYDRGELSGEAYWLRIAERAGAKIIPKRVEEIRTLDVEMWTEMNQLMLNWVGKLGSAGIKTALLSNMISDVAVHIRQKFQWLTSFDYIILSTDVGLVKPDAAIFEYCLRLLHVSPSEALFVDDLEPNVRAARALGMVAIQFQSAEQLKEQLEALGCNSFPEP